MESGISEIFPGIVVTDSEIGTVELMVSTESTDGVDIWSAAIAKKNATTKKILARRGHPRLRPLQSDIKDAPNPCHAPRLSCNEATL